MKDLLVHLNTLIASRGKAHIGCYACAFIVPFEKSMLTLFVSIEDICVFNLADVYSVYVFYKGTLRHAELVSRWDIVDTGEGFKNDVWEVREPQQTTAWDNNNNNNNNDGAASALGADPNIVVIGISTFCSTKRSILSNGCSQIYV